ncbi:MAG: Rieske 2Fe-2S domain-containing protein [candidate division Zixibacteria bacterium]|nr:Rieske 2Fe-2S domain-containing protein [candidate division Zixibacteria bacterium]
MPRIKMARLVDLPPGAMVEKQILARRVAVVNDNGTILGIQSECAHMRASLAKGGIKDGILTCSWHGWQYDLRTGECINNPGFRLKQYEVEIDGGDVYLLL